MLKYYDYSIVMQEFPDEISLCLNITNCPCNCEGCSESYLKENIGIVLTYEELKKILDKYVTYGITLVGFMGGDVNHKEIIKLSKFIKNNYNLKVGMYSGLDYIDLELANVLDYYKYGRFILPKGKPEVWHKQTCGPINFPWSNQKMYKNINGKLVDITEKFRSNPLDDLNRYIVK